MIIETGSSWAELKEIAKALGDRMKVAFMVIDEGSIGGDMTAKVTATWDGTTMTIIKIELEEPK